MHYETYKVGDIKRAIVKEANEFKAVLGKGAKNETGKADKEQGSDYKEVKHDYENSHKDWEQKGMHNIEVPNADKTYRDRVKAQMKGYTSAEGEKTAHSKKYGNDKFGNATFGDEGYVKDCEKHAEEVADNRAKRTKIGLTGRELDPKKVDDLHKTVFKEGKLDEYFKEVDKMLNEETKTIKKFVCKRTKFISEAHMLTRVPDSVKNEGQVFEMKDCEGYGYRVEWHSGKPIVEKLVNQKDVVEECEKIKKLYNFTLDAKTEKPLNEGERRIMEDKKVGDLLNKVRGLIK